jgi:hypothetical protein
MAPKKKVYVNKKSAEDKKKEVEELSKTMDAAVKDHFTSPENLKEYLSFMGKFHNYSLRNSILIDKQFRGAEAVGSYKFWKDQGYSVNKGEKGIKIFVPFKSNKFQDSEGKWKSVKYASPEEKKQIEDKKIEIRPITTFGIGHVFDASQTNMPSKDLPKIFPNKWYDGEVENYTELRKSLDNVAKDVGYEIVDSPKELGLVKGVAMHWSKTISLNKRNSEIENVNVLIHELAHADLHGEGKEVKDKPEKEFQAEMVSYVVSSHFGLDNKDQTLQYIHGWTKDKSLDDKEKLLAEVRDTSVRFINRIEETFTKEINQEKSQKKNNELEHSMTM